MPISASFKPTDKPGIDMAAALVNQRTGRPLRKARRVQEDSPFVDSAIAVSDASDSEQSDDSTTVTTATKRKRKRPSSPIEPVASDSDDLSSVVDDISSDAGLDSDDNSDTGPVSDPAESDSNDPEAETETVLATSQTTPEGTTQLILKDITINVPKSHQGPLHLQLHLPTHQTIPYPGNPTQPLTQISPTPKTQKTGFLSLPAELRNDIYRLTFVTPTRPITFNAATNFPHSAAFLRTCRQIHEEGRSILYSENHFLFARRSRAEGSYWEAEWNEVGFKAVRKFLRMVGRTNVGLLRRVTLLLEDAIPCLNPGLKTADERRFVGDGVLIEVLRRLGRDGRLEEVGLSLRGRRRVERTDQTFLKALTGIRADRVEFVDFLPGTDWPMESKQEAAVQKLCLAKMTRKVKMFPRA